MISLGVTKDMELKITTILLNVWVLSFSSSPLKSQTIMKCCRNGEELLVSEDLGSQSKCVSSEKPWEPFVFSPSQGTKISQPPEWTIQEAMKPHCHDNQALTSILCSEISPCIFFDDGNVHLDAGNVILKPNEYCADSKALLVCLIQKPGVKVYRCCGENAVFHENRNVCIHQEELHDAPPLLSNISTVDLIPGFPPCRHSGNIKIIGETKESVLQPNGSLRVNEIFLPSTQYCVERIKELNGRAMVFACSDYAPQRPIFQETDIQLMIYPVSMIISVIFLAATLITGCLLPTSHHVLHWKCQTHHIVCLMIGDLFMAIIQLAKSSLTGRSCKAIAIVTHFFFLGAFFWLNTMCFNIWWTFRDLRPTSLEKGQETLRLRVYACYAWGGSFLIAGLAALSDYLPPQPYNVFLRPRFGEKTCWFYGNTEILAYFYGPIGGLLIINIIFFIATARELTCGIWKGEFVKSTTERAALGRVCLKLVIVMGVSWIADVISWAVGGPQYFWYFTDVLNALQGLFIFIVVGWQPPVRANLKRLFNKNPRTIDRRQGNALSTTSHGIPSIGDSTTQNPSTKTVPMETIC